MFDNRVLVKLERTLVSFALWELVLSDLVSSLTRRYRLPDGEGTVHR